MDSLTALTGAGQSSPGWNEQSCVRGCITGDILNQENLYRHFYPRIMALVLRYTSDRDEAASILNNGFLKVYKNLHSFRNEGSLEGWIRKIVIHAVSDFFRYKHPSKEILHGVIPDIGHYDLKQHIPYDYQLLLTAFDGLPPATRAVVNLFIIDGYTHKEISSIMGISENTSKWHVSEGRKVLQQKLSKMNKTI